MSYVQMDGIQRASDFKIMCVFVNEVFSFNSFLIHFVDFIKM